MPGWYLYRLMAQIFQTPVALITLITEDRVWFKVRVALGRRTWHA